MDAGTEEECSEDAGHPTVLEPPASSPALPVRPRLLALPLPLLPPLGQLLRLLRGCRTVYGSLDERGRALLGGLVGDLGPPPPAGRDATPTLRAVMGPPPPAGGDMTLPLSPPLSPSLPWPGPELPAARRGVDAGAGVHQPSARGRAGWWVAAALDVSRLVHTWRPGVGNGWGMGKGEQGQGQGQGRGREAGKGVAAAIAAPWPHLERGGEGRGMAMRLGGLPGRSDAAADGWCGGGDAGAGPLDNGAGAGGGGAGAEAWDGAAQSGFEAEGWWVLPDDEEDFFWPQGGAGAGGLSDMDGAAGGAAWQRLEQLYGAGGRRAVGEKPQDDKEVAMAAAGAGLCAGRGKRPREDGGGGGEGEEGEEEKEEVRKQRAKEGRAGGRERGLQEASGAGWGAVGVGEQPGRAGGGGGGDGGGGGGNLEELDRLLQVGGVGAACVLSAASIVVHTGRYAM